ncbi:serine/threonine-protein kinase [Singulisphaera sp. Ch08]|uniref:Serine/threonine-protein kinase n=1 Tax=Singulisphaera sp. Ch08 TaxID=3120278 RepID=A0AAU7CK49_9BACT
MVRNLERFKDAWRMGQRPRMEDYLSGVEESELGTLLRDLLAFEIECRVNQGDVPLPIDYRNRFPGLTEVIDSVFDEPIFFRDGEGDPTVSLLNVTVGRTIEWRPPVLDCDATVSHHAVSRPNWGGRERTSGPSAGLSRLEIPGYRILDKIGRGAMGSVYKAVHVNSNTIVAIKFPHARPTRDAELESRFDREAKFVEMISHPCIVRAFDIGRADGRPFYAMEHVEGESVRDRLARKGVFGEEEAIGVALSCLKAIMYFNDRSLVHRDIKPANIMLGKDGSVKLTDLGLVHLTLKEDWRLEEFGMLVGTPFYMSPEQALRLDELDARSDLYSLGATLYEMVVGQSPHRGQTRAAILRWLLEDTGPPRSPRSINPTVSPDFSRLIMGMITKRRADRDEPKDSLERLMPLLSKETRKALSQPGWGWTPPGYLRYETDPEDVSEILGSVRKLLIMSDLPETNSWWELLARLCEHFLPQAKQEAFAPGRIDLMGKDESHLWDLAALWAASHRPDLILVVPYSIGIPDGSPEGDFFRRLKSDKSTRMIPIIRPAAPERVCFYYAFDYADAFLRVPFTTDDFRRTLYSVLRRRRAT